MDTTRFAGIRVTGTCFIPHGKCTPGALLGCKPRICGAVIGHRRQDVRRGKPLSSGAPPPHRHVQSYLGDMPGGII